MNILLADNDPDYLSTCAEILAAEGHRIYPAASPAEARMVLDERHVHLAILDIRLRDDDDEQDISGLTLAKEAAYQAIPKIMLTSWPQYQFVRSAMTPHFTGLPPAVDFLAKSEEPDVMLKAIQQVLVKHVRVNDRLVFNYHANAGMGSLAQLTSLVEPGLPTSQLSEYSVEIEDLWRRLFFDYDQITLWRLLWQQPARVALAVFASTPDKQERFLVTCGRIEVTRIERAAHARYAPHTGRGGDTVLALTADTLHYGATAWRLVGADIETLQPLAQVLRERPERLIRTALEHLYSELLPTWHQQAMTFEDPTDSLAYWRSQFKLDDTTLFASELRNKLQTLARVMVSAGLGQLSLKSDLWQIRLPNERMLSVNDPTRCLLADSAPAAAVPFSTTPGGLTADTLLLDNTGQIWPSNFVQAGVTSTLLDCVTLETSIRARLPNTGDLLNAHQFEREIMSLAGNTQPPTSGDVEPEHRRAFVAILSIRRWAMNAVGSDVNWYYTGLLCAAAAEFIQIDLSSPLSRQDINQALHWLLYMSTLCQLLSEATGLVPTRSPTLPLHLSVDNANRQVWIGSRRVDLTETEFNFVQYLFDRTGQLCKYEEIIRQIFPADDSPDNPESWITTNMSRIRKKLGDPRYLQTTRGRGCRLILQPD